MASFFRNMSRMTGLALRSQLVEHAIGTATTYLMGELQLADVRLKIALLKAKRKRHIRMLGKTIHRLSENEVTPTSHQSTGMIAQVLREIEQEIADAEEELRIRKEWEKKKQHGQT